MAKEVIVKSWCDFCFHDGERKVEGETLIVTVGFGKPHEIEVCEDHRVKTPFEEMVTALYEWGREYEGPNLDEQRYCPLASCERSMNHYAGHHAEPPFASVSGVRRHLTRNHDYTPEDAKAATERMVG